MKTSKNLLVFICVLWLSSCTPSYLMQEQRSVLADYNNVESYALPDKLVEISGLQIWENDFLGFNDSGGAAEIYRLDGSNPSKIKQTITLENAKNADWESIAVSDSLVFIGDFGNNLGERKNLTIYYFPTDLLAEIQDRNITAGSFSFFYPEQKVFEKHAYNHDFDMEAMLYYDKNLHLFTKEWKSEKTHHYTLDMVKGTQPAWLVENFDVNFLVTGADIIQLNNKYNRLGLVGYTRDGDVYLLLTDVKQNNKKWLNHPKNIIHLGIATEVGQVEGISFKNANEVCFSAEKITIDDTSKEQNITCFSLN